MNALIRLAAINDADQIAAIYAPFVRDTAISFELEPPDATEMERRLVSTLERFPWLVCEKAGEILGYAYANSHRARAAYQWSVDTAIYTRPQTWRSGIGRGLYSSLLSVLPLQGFYNAYAGVTLPNAASVGLHEAMEFEHVGIYRTVGFKLGRWHDVGWWQRALQPHVEPVSAPLPLSAVHKSAVFEANLAEGSRHLRL